MHHYLLTIWNFLHILLFKFNISFIHMQSFYFLKSQNNIMDE